MKQKEKNHIHKDIVSLCVLRSLSSDYFIHSIFVRKGTWNISWSLPKMPSLSESICCFDQFLLKRFTIDNYPSCTALCDGWSREKASSVDGSVHPLALDWRGKNFISFGKSFMTQWKVLGIEDKEEEKEECNQILWWPIKMGWWPIKIKLFHICKCACGTVPKKVIGI